MEESLGITIGANITAAGNLEIGHKITQNITEVALTQNVTQNLQQTNLLLVVNSLEDASQVMSSVQNVRIHNQQGKIKS